MPTDVTFDKPTRSHDKSLLKALYKIRDAQTHLANYENRQSICNQLVDVYEPQLPPERRKPQLTAVLKTLEELWKTWEHYSGDETFPVPVPKFLDRVIQSYFSVDPKTAARESYSYLPKWEGEYGRLRRELLDFLIAKLEEITEKEST